MAEQEISVSEYAAELVTIVRYCREMPFLFLVKLKFKILSRVHLFSKIGTYL